MPSVLSLPNHSWPASRFWKFCCFWPRSIDDAEFHAMRAEQLGELVAELQRIVVRIHVVRLRPQVADLAAAAPPVEQVGRKIRARLARREHSLEVDAARALRQQAGILEVVVQREPAPAHQHFVGHRGAEHRDDVAGDRPAAVLADVRGRQRHDVFRRPPHATRALGCLAFARDPDIGLGAVADVPVETRLEVVAVVRLQAAVDVVIEVGGIGVVRQRVEAGEVPSRRGDVGRQVVVRRRLARVRESFRDAQLRDAVQVRSPVGEQLAVVAVPHRLAEGAGEVRAGVHLLALAFVRDEEEQPVPVLGVAVAEHNRAADVAAGILIGALGLRGAGDAVGPIVGGELVIAPVVVGRAVELRAAGLGDAADVHPPGAVFRREIRALDLHLLNHVVVQRDDDPVVAADVDERRAVERDRVARGADAVDGVALGVVAAGAEADRLALVELGDDAGEDAHQFERAAADDRQVVDLLGGEHTFTRAGLASE